MGLQTASVLTSSAGMTAGRNRILCDVFPRSVGDLPLEVVVNLNSNAVPRWSGAVSVLKEDLQGYLYAGYRPAVLAGTSRGAKALCEDLTAEGIPAEVSQGGFPPSGKVSVLEGTLSSGFEIMPLTYVMAQVTYLLITQRMVLYNVSEMVIESMVQSGDIGFISIDSKGRYLGSNETAKEFIPELSSLITDSPIRNAEEIKETSGYYAVMIVKEEGE